MNKRKILFFIFTFSFLIFISSCVNLEQQTSLNQDGSGTINLHYWTKNSNLSMGDEIGGFSFSEDNAKKNYNSSNTEVKDIKLEKNDNDSTTHVRITIAFKDINKLSETEGFNKINASWAKGNGGMDFKYILKKDTLISKNLGMNEYILNYKFNFPGEIISSNGTAEGNSVTWNKTIADLKDDVVMTASVKTKSKVCGILGYEFLIIFSSIIVILKKNLAISCVKNLGTRLKL